MQIIALTSSIIAFGGLLYYLESADIYSQSINYLVFHILTSITFMLVPTNGIFKSLTVKSKISKLSFNLIIYSLLGICLTYSIFEFLRQALRPYVGHLSILTSVSSLIFITVLVIYYSRKWVLNDLESQILKNEAMELQKTIENVQSLSKIAIVNGNQNNYKWTSEIFEILEIPPIKGNITEDLILKYAMPQSIELISKKREESLNYSKPGDTINFEENIIVKTPKGNKKCLKCFINFFIEPDLRTRTMHGFIEDITEEMEIKKDLEDSFQNQTILLKEVHHRVKNNLQIILSLINLEIRLNKEGYEDIVKKTRNRILSMATIHEQVYNSSDIAHIDSEQYIQLTLGNLFNVYDANINLDLDIEHYEIHMDKAIPLGLIINELGLNTIKYAFNEDETGSFHVKFRESNNNCEIEIWDDGKGLPDDFDFNSSKSLGFTIIKNIIKQLDGEYELLDLSKGFGIKITFKDEI